MMLAGKERCPIHKNYSCLCRRVVRLSQGTRSKGSKWETVRPGVRRIRDEHADHPDGYRYRLSPAEIRKVLLKKLGEKNECCICGKAFESLDGIVPEHRLPKGMGGSRRDDRADNIFPAHSECNLLKASQRNFKL